MDTIERVKQIYARENDIRAAVDEAFAHWKQFIINLNGAQHMEAEINKTQFMMGSLSDGAFSARLFAEDELNFEGDFLVEIAELPQEAAVAIPNKPGFYLVKNDGRFLNYLIGAAKFFLTDPRTIGSFVKLFLDMGFSPGYILGMSIKKLVEEVAGLSDGKDDVTRIMAMACGFEKHRIRCDMNTEFNGPAATQIMRVLADDKHVISVSFDVVVGGRLSFWPQEAKSWENRERQWPPKSVVKQIIDQRKIHLVAKPSTDMAQSGEWSLTFLAEKRIIQEQTLEMKFTYYLFKILFYAHLKAEVDGKTTPSYLAKTTMFWLCEELDPSCWTEQNIQTNLQLLLRRLFDSLDKNQLPHYFVPTKNLLANVSDRLVYKVKTIDIRYKLLTDPIGCLPTCFQKVNDRMDFLAKVMAACGQEYRKLAHEATQPQDAAVRQIIDDDLD